MAKAEQIPGFTADERVTKIGFCEQLKGGVIMDVTNAEQARIAEQAGAVAVMALERRTESDQRESVTLTRHESGLVSGRSRLPLTH